VRKSQLSDEAAQDIRRRWWADQAEVEQLAYVYQVSRRYIDGVIRRRSLDGLPLVPGERTLYSGEQLSKVKRRVTPPEIA
jgi:hypothetical protein